MDESWSSEKCLELIELYEKYPNLWDSKHPLYSTKRKRQQSWQNIADNFDTDITCIKRKMCSLLGSFRAQKSKGKKLIGDGSNIREVYVSKWFAFDKMLFLLDQKEPQSSFGNDDCDGNFETLEVKSENDSDVEILDTRAELPASLSQSTYIIKDDLEKLPLDVTLTEGEEEPEETVEAKAKLNQSFTLSDINNEYGIHYTTSDGPADNDSNVSTKDQVFRKRKSKDESQFGENAYRKHMKTSQTLRQQQHRKQYNNSGSIYNYCLKADPTDATPIASNLCIFGQYIATKLHGYTSKTRAIAENAINNILFEADMGWYESASPQPRSRLNPS